MSTNTRWLTLLMGLLLLFPSLSIAQTDDRAEVRSSIIPRGSAEEINQPEASLIKFEETFDGITIPADWQIIDNDGSGSAWEFRQGVDFLSGDSVRPEAGQSFFFSNFSNANANGLIDEWLITPLLPEVENGDQIVFYAGAIDGDFKDSLKVWVSTTDSNPASFTEIAYFKAEGPIGAWNRYAFDVSAFAGNQIYAAINYYVVDGGPNGTHSDNIWFDHLTLENPNYARLQVIHNAADPAAASVDVYVNDGLLLDDFAFRAATPFIDVPAGVTLNIGIAPGNSGSAADTLVNIPVVLAAGETYVAIANGVLNPANFEANPDGRSTAFQLLVNPAGQEASSNTSTVEFSVLHGATDAPTVDVVARGVATLVDNAAYTDITPYIGVPAASYILDITDASGSVTVASFMADLSGLAGGAAQVFASGFLTPANDQNGEPFGIFAALPDGNVVEFPALEGARLQVIHNAADPAAASVDVYVNDGLLLDDFAFRAATPFIDVDAGVTLNIGIAPGNSGSAADTLVNIPVVLSAGETYVAIANGVLNPANFEANPDGRSTAFQLLVNPAGQEASSNSSTVEFSVLHGATDAPTVDVVARGVATLVDDAAYTDITPYIGVPAARYLLDITDATGSVTVATFEADLSGLAGGAAQVFASGFLTPANDQNGEPFGIFAALPDGNVVEFPAVTQARLQVIHNAADPAAASVDVYVNDGLLLDDFAFRAATPFIDVAAGVTLNIGIAPGSSGSAADTLVNIPVVLTAGETYVAIANGVLDPTGFAANPDGRSTAFQLLVNPAGQEASGVSNEVALSVVHGATDAPTVDVQARGVATLVDDAAYTDITPYFSVPASSYILDITDATGNTVVASFGVDLSGLGGGAATVLASGFLTPGNNQNGEAFGLIAVLPDGTVLPLDPVLSIATPLPGVVSDFALEQNYPNPFNPSTTIEYAIPRNERVTVTIYNIAGQVVARLLDRQQNAGRYQLTFDASNLSSGLYFYQIRAGQYQATKRMTLLK